MISGLDRRRRWWNGVLNRNQGKTTTKFLDKNIDKFKDADVLEIGVGWGRQKQQVQPLAASYAIADISPTVLESHTDIDANDKFLISSYDVILNRKFDVIHFWYVVHHMLPQEYNSFFAFLKRHIKDNGCIIFNIQDVEGFKQEGHKVSLGDDGIKTFDVSSQVILEEVGNYFDTVHTERYEDEGERLYINVMAS